MTDNREHTEREAEQVSTPPRIVQDGRVGQVDATRVPRFAGPATFARLPRIDEVSDVDVAVVGVPSAVAPTIVASQPSSMGDQTPTAKEPPAPKFHE